MPQPRSLVGDVLERNISSSSAKSTPRPPESVNNNTGFPSVQHRSKSAFAKAREAQQNQNGQGSRSSQPPVVQSTTKRAHDRDDDDTFASVSVMPPSDSAQPPDWRRQMSRENERTIEAMTDEEREQEKAEILERFGPGISELFKKVAQNKENGLKRPRNGESPSALGILTLIICAQGPFPLRLLYIPVRSMIMRYIIMEA